MSFVRVPEVAARLVPHRWDWADGHGDAITANFARRQGLKPAIFNGPVLMVADLVVSAGRAEARFFRTDYARLLAHLDLDRPDRSVRNGFAMGALRGRDGAFVLGEMGAHTANAGRVYCPAGTPDPGDVRPDGSVDLAGSIRRELEEETGIAVTPDALGAGWTIVEQDGLLAFFREIVLDMDAEAIGERIRVHLAQEAEPELAGCVIVRSPADLDPGRMPGYLITYLTAAFAQG